MSSITTAPITAGLDPNAPITRAEVSQAVTLLATETNRVTHELGVQVTDVQNSVAQLGSATGQIKTTLDGVSVAVQQITTNQASPVVNPGTQQDLQALSARVLSIELSITNLTSTQESQARGNTAIRDAADKTFTAINGKLDALQGMVPMNTADIQNLTAMLRQYRQEAAQAGQSSQGQGGGGSHQGGGGGGRQGSLLEMKSIANLTVMDSDRNKYKEWRDKLVNAIRSARPAVYSDLKVVLDQLERGEVMSLDDITNVTGWDPQMTATLSTELYCVLVDKTTGEAANRVHMNSSEEGFGAYQGMHRWFKQSSNLATTERVRALMHPDTAKREDEVMVRIEKWKRDMEDLEREYPDKRYSMSDSMKKVALTMILTGEIKHWLDMEEDDWESDRITYEALFTKIHTRAHRKRVQSIRDTGGPKRMDLGVMNDQESHLPSNP
jgi:hypothetical protein